MDRKQTIKTNKTLTAFIMLLTLLLAASSAFFGIEAKAGASSSTNISQLRKEKAEYERQKKEINEKINALEFERLAEIDKKKILDERIMLTGKEISNLKETINQYNLLVTEKEYEIIISQNREEEQLKKYKARVRDMEENGVFSYLEVIFDSKSFTDLIARLDFFYEIMNADETNYQALQQARADTEAAKDNLDAIKAELDAECENMETLEDELQEQLNEAHALILKMESDLEAQRRFLEVVVQEENRVQKEIRAAEDALRRQREAERQAMLAQQPQTQSSGEQSAAEQDSGGAQGSAQAAGTGELMWPVGGKVISNYGMRSGRMHQGLDIGAPHGTPVVAADSGTVTTSAYGSGYGNYVVVSHGNGMTTLYSHLSTRSVSVGAAVSKGQQVGLVGSTGNATTPHLHFEVSVDGARVNPLDKL